MRHSMQHLIAPFWMAFALGASMAHAQTQPAAEPPKADAPKAEAPKADAPKADAAKAPAAKADPATSAIGVWTTIDDKTGQPRSEITISETNGVLSGRITKFLDANANQAAVCSKCAEGDARKDKPIMGMAILTGLKKTGDEWTGGQILDPNEGKVYSAKLKLVEGGKKAEMRGFVGSPMFGRTQTWVRK
jgi:uncharacterized protein (DUF2147 family)